MSNQPPAGPPEGWEPRPQGQGWQGPPQEPQGWERQIPERWEQHHQAQQSQEPQAQGWGPQPPERPSPSNRRIWLAIVGFIVGLLLGPFLGVFIGAVLTGEGRSAAWRILGVLVFPALFAW